MQNRKKMRLSGWDYSTEGMYFLTICAKERRSFFGQVVGCGILDAPYVHLSKYGDSVQRAMLYLSEHTQNITLEKWIIMPNHLHILASVEADDEGASRMPRPTDGAIPKFVSVLKRFTNREIMPNFGRMDIMTILSVMKMIFSVSGNTSTTIQLSGWKTNTIVNNFWR